MEIQSLGLVRVHLYLQPDSIIFEAKNNLLLIQELKKKTIVFRCHSSVLKLNVWWLSFITCCSTTAVKTAFKFARSWSLSWATMPASSSTSWKGFGSGLTLITTVSHRSVRVVLPWASPETPVLSLEPGTGPEHLTRMFPGWRSAWTKLSTKTWNIWWKYPVDIIWRNENGCHSLRTHEHRTGRHSHTN